MRVTPYLYFRGACEAALEFYAAVGLGRVVEMRRYAGTPMVERFGDDWANKVLHSLFEGPHIRLFASDGPDSEPVKGSAIFLEPDDVDAGSRLFAELSQGGRVTVPFAKQFWGDWYGNFTDKFGVQWAMNCPE